MSFVRTKEKVTGFCRQTLLPLLLLLSFSLNLTASESIPQPELQNLAGQLRADLNLSIEEKQWLQQHPVIRVGVDAGYAPYSFINEQGEYVGVAPDYMRLLSEVLDLKFETVPGLSWQQIIEGAQKQELDLIATAVTTPEREQFLSFTQIYLPTPLVIMTRVGGVEVVSAEQLKDKQVALVRGYSSTARVLEEHPEIKSVLVDSPLDGLNLVATDQADAYVGVLGVSFYLAQQSGLTNLKVASRYDLKTNGQRFAVRKDWSLLRDMIDKVLTLMPQRDRNRLMRHWVSIDLKGLALDYTESPPLQLTAEERAWLEENPRITIGTMNNWPPMDYVDSDGKAIGIGAQFIELMNRRLDGRLHIVPDDWSVIYKAVTENQLDALIGISPRPSREAQFNFTRPYLNVPHVIFARRDAEYAGDLEALNGKTVALEAGFFLQEIIAQDYPGITLKEYSSTSDALHAVSKGEADAYVGNRAVAMYVLHNKLLTNIEEQGKIKDSASVNAIGTRKDLPILRDILQKSLDNITAKERLSVLQEWVVPSPLGNITSVKLTLDEWDWLDQHPVIWIKGNESRFPIEFRDTDGKYKGITVEYLELLSRVLGVRFEYLTKGVDSSSTPTVTMISATDAVDERAAPLLYSSSYLDLPIVIFTRDNIPYIADLSELQGKAIAVTGAQSVVRGIREQYPDLNIKRFQSLPEALEALQNKQVDAFLGTILETSHFLRRKGYNNIRVSGQTPFISKISMAIQDQSPELVQIINKALAQISTSQKDRIAAYWIGVQVKEPPDYAYYLKLLSAAVVIIALFLGWNAYLHRVSASKGRRIREQNEALLRSQKILKDAQRVAHLGSWYWEIDRERFQWSEELQQLLGVADQYEQSLEHLFAAIHPEDRQYVRERVEHCCERSEAAHFEHRLERPDGSIRFVEQHTDITTDRRGHKRTLIGTVLDITARKQAEHELRKLSEAFENSPIAITVTDSNGLVEYVNPCFCEMTGYSAAEVVGSAVEMLPAQGPHETEVRELWECIRAGKVWRGESRNKRRNGELYWESITVAPVLNDRGVFSNILIIKQDITQTKKMTAELFREANFSALTEQPNRAFMLAQAEMRLSEQVPVALVLVDMLNIKRINDTLGVEAGDQMIVEAADRLNQFVGPAATVGHLGGGEFVYLIERPQNDTLEKLIEQVKRSFRAIFEVAGQSIHQSICIGVSASPEDALTPQQLLSHAYVAVSEAKNNGSYSHAYYTEHLSRDAQDSLYLEGLLLKALANQELQVYFQPKVDTQGNFRGAEALLRWNNPELGFVSPGRFVPIAEQSELIMEIGRWVIDESCKQASLWQAEIAGDFSVSINMSPKQFYDQGIVEYIDAVIKKYGLQSQQVEIEVTEGVFMEGETFVRERIQALKALGISLAMDDFGTGYSSLQYLRSYPFDTLKIDRSFVMELPESRGDVNLVRAIIKMGRALGLKTVAEGVETVEQATFLRTEGCDLIQGYLFAKPMPQEQFIEWLQSNQVRIL